MKFSNLLEWSEKNFHSLPWRMRRSLYTTLVSEIMLQQTTVATVKNHFEHFLLKFPNLKKLSQASEEELTVAWKGLGYYRRARNLKKIAEIFQTEFKGVIPSSYDELIQVPGIGPYTASALLAIGMDQKELAIDANIERVVSRIYGIEEVKGLKLQAHIRSLFREGQILKGKFSPRKINEALMDLGRTYCQARKVSCEMCPMKNDCYAFSHQKSLFYPVTDQIHKKRYQHTLTLLRMLVRKGDQVLVYEKKTGEWLAGQYELPTFVIDSTDSSFNQYPSLKIKVENTLNFKSAITKYKINNVVMVLTKKELMSFSFDRELVWRDIKDSSNLTTSSYKAIKIVDKKIR